MLEQQQSQLVAGLQKLYWQALDRNCWTGSPLKDSTNGQPLTHDILDRLGVLKQDGAMSDEAFEDNFGSMQQRLIASGAGLMKREESSDGFSDHARSPVSEVIPSKRSRYSDNVAKPKYPPTPPMDTSRPRHSSEDVRSFQSPQPMTSNTVTPSFQPSMLSQWQSPITSMGESMDFVDPYNEALSDFNMASPQLVQPAYADMMQTPLPLNEWSRGDAMRTIWDPMLT
ncbi:MAG: hypothetical protein Q9227_008083 [Pyrenula ochraceoflavens]